MLSLVLLFASYQPINQVGSSCPFGYYSQAGYCVPNSGIRNRVESIPRTNSICPYGTYATGNYCSWNPHR
jgi:hypothetical protein